MGYDKRHGAMDPICERDFEIANRLGRTLARNANPRRQNLDAGGQGRTGRAVARGITRSEGSIASGVQ